MNWSSIKRELKNKGHEELAPLLKTLFELNPENKAVFETFLSQSESKSLSYYEKEISRSINPSMNSPVDLRRGRKAITAYKKIAPDDLWGRINLMMHYVEEGADFTLEYGDIDGPFYNSLMRMIDSILELTDKLTSVQYAHLAERFANLDQQTKDQIGWGFSDCISDAAFELQSRVKSTQHSG